MNVVRGPLAHSLVVAATLVFSGCAVTRKPPPQNPKDHAFISYFGPRADGTGTKLAVKDLIDVRGQVTSAGSEYLFKNNPPAARDAECLQIARERNVHIVGKTNVSELALGVSGMNEYFGTPKSPLKRRGKLIPGGSSSGSAVAVATGLADVSFGTDTAGSIRVPAACCGVLGLKTTFGLVSLKGVAPISPRHLDTVGPLAKDVPRLVQGMDLLQRGFRGKYSAAVAAAPSARSIKVGRLRLGGTDPAIDEAIDDALARAGYQVVQMSPAFREKWDKATADGRSLAVADSWLTDRKYIGASGVSLVTKAIIKLGEIEYTMNYDALLRRRLVWQKDLRQAFREVDVIAVPTLQSAPPSIPFWGRSAVFEARVALQQNTAGVNYAGNPAVAVPVPLRKKDLPLTSVQLVGPRLSEAQLIAAARFLVPTSNNSARPR